MPKTRGVRKRTMEKVRNLFLSKKASQKEKKSAEKEEGKSNGVLIKESIGRPDGKIKEERQTKGYITQNYPRNSPKKPRGIRFSRKAVQRNKYLREKFGLQKQVMGFCPQFCSIKEENEDGVIELSRRIENIEENLSAEKKRPPHKTTALEPNSGIAEEEEEVYYEVNIVERCINKASTNPIIDFSNQKGNESVMKDGSNSSNKCKEKVEISDKDDSLCDNSSENSNREEVEANIMSINYTTPSDEVNKMADNKARGSSIDIDESLSQIELSEATILGQVKDEILIIWHRLMAIENDFNTMRTTMKEMREKEPLSHRQGKCK